MNKERQLDQFYTNTNIARDCYKLLINYMKENGIEKSQWLEPSAGSGAFFDILDGEKIGIDLEPKSENIIQSDFLEYDLPDDNYITIGNPPFGKNSSLAIKFFNKCAMHSKIVAFIVPKTFKKDSVKNKLNNEMHLEFEFDIPENSFHFKNETVNVPCVFQIWLKKNIIREKINKTRISEDFIFTKRDDADFAFQRVGARAGALKGREKFDKIADPSHNFIKFINPDQAILLFFIDWKGIKENTAGNPSISKTEMIQEYNKYKDEYFIGVINNYYIFKIKEQFILKYLESDNVISYYIDKSNIHDIEMSEQDKDSIKSLLSK